VIFHITTVAAWDAAVKAGAYHTEGPFIHLSTAAQWPLTLQRFFKGKTGLLLLHVDETKLTADLRWEPADGDTFPHLYGALNLDAVTQALTL
jgi:uncharacterized protein (DUF952 family)